MQSRTLEAAIHQTEILLSRGEAKQAVETIQPAALALPGNAHVQLLAARAYRDLGNTEQSLARYKLAAASTKDAALWGEFVRELLRAGQKGRARKAASNAPLRGPEKKRLLDLAKTGLQTAAVAAGGVPEAKLEAIKGLLARGQLDAVAQEAGSLLETHPKSAFLHNVLGLVALASQDPVEAQTHFERTLQLSPSFAGAKGNLGLALTFQEKHEEAIAVLSKAAIESPKSLEVRTNLALAHLKSGDFESAALAADAALKIAPLDPDALGLIATAKNRLADYSSAESYLGKLRKLRPDDATVLVQTFIALEGLGRHDEALVYATQNESKSVDLLRRKGQLLSQIGRMDEAAAALRTVIEMNPQDANAYLNYGGLRTWRHDDPMLEKLEDFAANTTDVRFKGLGHYALAKAQLDLHQDGEVMPTLHTANKAQAASAQHGFDPALMEREVSELIETWDREAVAALADNGARSVAPVFIVGMPRSGSTLLDQILCAHPAFVGVGEDSVVSSFFPLQIEASPASIVEASRRGSEALRRVMQGSTQVVDKYLNNFLRIGALASAFPNARFLQTARDPRSVAFSIYSNAMKVDGHPHSTDLSHIAAFYLSYQQVMRHWHAVLGDRIREVSYEALVSDPERETRILLEWLGVPWDDACLQPRSGARRVKTLSSMQVRGEISTASIEKWRRFEDDLAPFITALEQAGEL